MSHPHSDLPDTPSEQLPNAEYETQDRLIDRRSFLARAGALGAAGVALTQLPPIVAREAKAQGFSSPYTMPRPEVLSDPTEATISEAAALIKTKRLKPSELTEAYLQRIAAFAGIDGEHLQLVRIGMRPCREHPGDAEPGQLFRRILDPFHFDADRIQRRGDARGIRVRFEVVLQPGKRELHARAPPPAAPIPPEIVG